MNYIYDIYLNLNKNLYDFFDWDKKDKIERIKKIPIFRINELELKQIVSSKFKIENNFLNIIKNKTEFWNESNKNINCALFSDTKTIIAVLFDKLGISTKKSFLYVDEELEVLEDSNSLNLYKIKLEILEKTKFDLRTRKQTNDI